MKPFIAQFLISVAGNESIVTESTEGTIPDDIRFSTRQTRSVEDTRPDDGLMMWKETVETATVEKTEPDDHYLLSHIKTATNEGTEPDDLQFAGIDDKHTFTHENTEPDDMYFEQN